MIRSEFGLIGRIKSKIPRRLQGKLGIGDDAEILPALGAGYEGLVTTDTLVEGVDFIFKKAKPQWVGRKALAVNLSDIAAMGGEPVAFVVTLGLPPTVSERWVIGLYDGIVKLATQYSVKCLGGDISRAKEIVVSITLIGKVKLRRAVTRRGAKPGDWIAVTGALGGSILGKHFSFEPRLREGKFLSDSGKVTSMIDISDGLLQDLKHILKLSKASAKLHRNRIPVSQNAKSLEHALTDGEDFELLFTVKAKDRLFVEHQWKKKFPRTKLSWIGRIVKGSPEVFWQDTKQKIKFKKMGYSHF